MKVPCRYCKKHSESCHASCEEYAEYTKQMAVVMKRRRDEQDVRGFYAQHKQRRERLPDSRLKSGRYL